MKYRTRRRFASFFRGTDIARRIILGVIFWTIVLIVLLSVLFGRSRPVPNGSILILHPHGAIVDSYTTPASYQGVPVSGFYNETLLGDMTGALRLAASDRRITGVWLYLNDLYTAGPAAAGEFADAIENFSDSGKPLLATSDTYDTTRYRIAAAADAIVVDRLGEVFPAGYGSWRAYYSEGLERLGGEARLFRSGESKTGAENFVLDGMSAAALRNEQRLLGDLWKSWLDGVATHRNLDSAELDAWIQNYDTYLVAAGGDGSKAAADFGLVDAVETGGVVEGYLEELFGDQTFAVNGPDGQPLNRIESWDYLAGERRRARRVPSVAVIPISGSLVYGEGSTGTAGSTDVVSAIEQARAAPGVEALILRIDSPGGDVRAGEQIRRAVESTRNEWNVPVITSMGDLAASGGYWIALESDLIVTRDETITGSIGVYSLSLTFEKALADWLGIRIDGWGTTPWSGSTHIGRSLDERTAALYEASVMDIDTMFKDLVAEKRDLDPESVTLLAGGIPWSGRRALELGLADREGGLETAIEAAVELSSRDSLQVLYFDRYTDPREEMLNRLLWGPSARRAGLFGSGFFRGYSVR